jgi:ABC-type amino acid transport substrate-binding protein
MSLAAAILRTWLPLAGLVTGCGLWPLAGLAQPSAAPAAVLRVGVVDGSQPCSDQEHGQWRGLAVELWSHLANRERLPFVFEARSSAAALIRDVQRGALDVGVGCLTITPERVNSVGFSLPFQEMGLGVMQRRNRLEAGEAVLRSLLGPDLLKLLAAYLLSIGVVSLLLWQCERHGDDAEHRQQGARRSFAKIFQILATGPGTNTIAITTRGHGLVIVSYLVRIVTASLLVTTITVKVVQQPVSGQPDLRQLPDLEGRRVAARPGSVSEEVLKSINSSQPVQPIQIVALPQVSLAAGMLLDNQVDAVVAEDLQLHYALQRSPRRGLVISLQGLQRESQAFALSPALPEGIVQRINRGLSTLKRNGVVSELQRAAMNKS